MTTTDLCKVADAPETHRDIVGDYDGAYALGVRDNPPAFILRVETGDTSRFPTTFRMGDEEVPVVVEGDFVQPFLS